MKTCQEVDLDDLVEIYKFKHIRRALEHTYIAIPITSTMTNVSNEKYWKFFGLSPVRDIGVGCWEPFERCQDFAAYFKCYHVKFLTPRITLMSKFKL